MVPRITFNIHGNIPLHKGYFIVEKGSLDRKRFSEELIIERFFEKSQMVLLWNNWNPQNNCNKLIINLQRMYIPFYTQHYYVIIIIYSNEMQ